jgi:glycosyltransferase involved in cell wall biosynthesis
VILETKYTAVFPVRNERESLRIVLPFLMNNSFLLGEIIIVADFVEDNSFDLVKHFDDSRVPVRFLLNSSSGVFSAINTGVDEANFEYIIICAADEVIPVLKLDEMASALLGNFEYVSATRYSKQGKRYGGNLTAKILSFFANFALRIRFQSKMTDFTTGYKGFAKSAWPILKEGADGEGWSCVLRFSLNAIRHKLSVCEVSIISVDRSFGGESTFQLWKWVMAYIRKLI